MVFVFVFLGYMIIACVIRVIVSVIRPFMWVIVNNPNNLSGPITQ